MVKAQPYRQLLDDLRAAMGMAGGAQVDALVDRAAAMLAGRVGCRLGEARGHLQRIAEEHAREVRDVAAELLVVLESQARPDGEGPAAAVVDEMVGAAPPNWPAMPASGAGRFGGPGGPADGWLSDGARANPLSAQQVLDAVSGAYAWLAPVRDIADRVIDFVVRAASPEARDLRGRRGTAMVGMSIREAYPGTLDGGIWGAYLEVLADGNPRQVGPLEYRDAAGQGNYSLRVHPLAGGLLVGWVRHDGDAGYHDRITQTERLARLGWGEWNLVTGQVTWSEELYRIYERDPALGPLPQEESAAIMLPEDQHVLAESAEAFARGETVDVTFRVRVGGQIKHLRSVIDAVRDGGGKPLRLYGIVQDVTSREIARVRLAAVERELREHQQTLAAEHRLAARLQQIVLPIPGAPIDLPGLRVAVRYLPAERASRVGGDWYHAATAPDGRVLLAVGDVAGHGLQAATTMAQLRHAMAALAVTTSTDPAELLSYLNRLLCAGEPTGSTATAVVARYDPDTGLLTWAQAGHPAPLRTRRGTTASLRRPRGPLLGAVPDARYENATVELRREDLLVIYTDGLVEDRTRSLEEGLAPVVATLNEISAAANQAPLAELLDRLTRANPDDDTCVLAARLHGEGREETDPLADRESSEGGWSGADRGSSDTGNTPDTGASPDGGGSPPAGWPQGGGRISPVGGRAAEGRDLDDRIVGHGAIRCG